MIHQCRTISLLFIQIIIYLISATYLSAQEPSYRSISGVYPHLAYWNEHGECGTGAVVPWAGKLWVITYAPHFPKGSTDKLYEISPNMDVTTFEGSVGGTPANRMVHRETNQLLIGPYVIDQEGGVRVIPPSVMYGRLTGNARHLFDPERKVYYATMEEGFYEVDLVTLDVKELFRDEQLEDGDIPRANLPGYHGKGLYSGQGRLIYANNGEQSPEARIRPDIPSGCLAEWNGKDNEWTIIRRNQFTDVRGPGDLFGNANPETDPIWAIGWDHRSLILMLLDDGVWHTYRLPKASHAYDGAHGWNTEWPRIHDIGEDNLAMNMHGMFWKFPKTFSYQNSAGLAPRSTYLKVIGDYCRWGDQLVIGCDDTAKSEFLNTRRAKGKIAPPGQSHSNLWFTKPSILDELGPAFGRGAVWSNDDVQANTPSDPYLFKGFDRRGVHIEHNTVHAVEFAFEIDRTGNGKWTALRTETVPANSSTWFAFDSTEPGAWIRVSTDRDCVGVSVQFAYLNKDPRDSKPDKVFDGLVTQDENSLSGGYVRTRGDGLKTLGFAATQVIDGESQQPAFYEMGGNLKLQRVDDPAALKWTIDNCQVPQDILIFDDASIIYTDDNGNRWRLPRSSSIFDKPGLLGFERIDREVVTERDLFHSGGLFYELPARNAGGFAKIRPISSHRFRIKDYCSYRGMLIMTGVSANAPKDNPNIIHSEDGNVALWAGVVDDLWKLGKPIGTGGPWKNSIVQAGVPSDPYLMTGFDKKTVKLSHNSDQTITITLQVDIDGAGTWVEYKSFNVPANQTIQYKFPDRFSAYWVRAESDKDAKATVMFKYE
jgi:hypothetical protein